MKLRFVVGIVLILGVVGWLAVTGFEEAKSYYYTCDQAEALGQDASGARFRLAGNVVEGSIAKTEGQISFTLEYNGASFPVRYVGDDPVPDTFKDGSQAVVDGTLGPDGVFTGHKIQAKCASKYEAEYSETSGGEGTV